MRPPIRLTVFLLLIALGVVGGVRLLGGQEPPGADCSGAGCGVVAQAATATATVRPSPSATPRPTGTPRPSATPTVTPVVVVLPYGSVDAEGNPIPTPTRIPPFVPISQLVQRYGDTLYPSLDAMPEEARYWVNDALVQVATFFEVRPQDLLALLQAQNEGGVRLARPAAEGEVVRGVAGMPLGWWNGWASPRRDGYETTLRTIEQYGGVGFDWLARDVWERWNRGERAYGYSSERAAEPEVFENSLAALARYLQWSGLTAAHAEADPAAHAAAFAEAVTRLQEPPQLGVAVSDTGEPVAPPALRAAFVGAMDRAWAVRLDEEEGTRLVDASPVAAEVAAGRVSAEEGAQQILQELVTRWVAEGQAARAEGVPLSWPFVADEQDVAAQGLAVRLTGHALAPWQLVDLRRRTGDDPAAMEEFLSREVDAKLYEVAREKIDVALRRSARGLPLRAWEVAALVVPELAASNSVWRGQWGVEDPLARIEYRLRRLPEFRELNGDLFFVASPLDPMPTSSFGFGVPVSYQPDGFHTGIDVRGQREAGKEPTLYAVDTGTVTYVGPLFCNRDGACRGPYAIMIHHGGNVYSIYSHNSEASVRAGDIVQPGQPIGRQGSLGYSRRSHLHFEVHVGAPFSGDWTQPFYGGEFVDPELWLPREG